MVLILSGLDSGNLLYLLMEVYAPKHKDFYYQKIALFITDYYIAR